MRSQIRGACSARCSLGLHLFRNGRTLLCRREKEVELGGLAEPEGQVGLPSVVVQVEVPFSVVLPWYLGMGVAFVVAGAAQGLGRLIAWRLSHRNKHKKSMKPRLAETEKSALSAERTSRLHGTGVTLKREIDRAQNLNPGSAGVSRASLFPATSGCFGRSNPFGAYFQKASFWRSAAIFAGFSGHPMTTDDHSLMTWLGPADLDDQRLVGMAFAKWVRQHFDASAPPSFPSANLGKTAPAEILPSFRAAQFYDIAAVTDSVVAGDTRPDDVRISQFLRWLGRAREANPSVPFPVEALGR